MKKGLALVVWIFSLSYVNAATYYVKNGGNDNLDGLTDATAWETIAKVEAMVQSGDIVYFNSGDTWSGANPILYMTVDGVTYDGSTYGTGTRATFTATSRTSSNGIVQIARTNIVFKGFRVDANSLSMSGIAIGYTSPSPAGAISNITVHNCEVTNGITVDNPNPSYYYGIHVSMSGSSGQPASDITITDNWVHHTGHEGIAVYPQTSSASRVNNVLVRNNKIHNTGLIGVRGSPLDIANDADNVTAEFNSIYDCSGGISIVSYGPVCYGAPSPNGVVVRYNVLDNNDGGGISIRGYFCHEGIDGDGEIYGNIVNYGNLSLHSDNWNNGAWKIYNNVFRTDYSAGQGYYVLDGGLYRTSMNAENVEIKNNIFIGTGLRLVRDQANALNNIDHSNNLYYRTDSSSDIIQTSELSNANAVPPTEVTVTHDDSYTYFMQSGGTDWTSIFSSGQHVKWSGFANDVFNDRLFIITEVTADQITSYNIYLRASGPVETATVTGEKWILTTLSSNDLQSAWEPTAQNSDPLFVNPVSDFNLQASSPAIDNGVDLGSQYNLDFDGLTRPQGSGWDIGAYEYISATSTGDAKGDGTSLQIKDYKLSQNYPNPFNPATTIRFEIPETNEVTLKIYDVLSREVATLVNEVKNAGKYDVKFDASHLSSGVYFYRLHAGRFIQIKKFMLMK